MKIDQEPSGHPAFDVLPSRVINPCNVADLQRVRQTFDFNGSRHDSGPLWCANDSHATLLVTRPLSVVPGAPLWRAGELLRAYELGKPPRRDGSLGVTIQVRGVGSALVGRIAGVRTEACVYACCKPRYGEAERDV